MTDTRKWSALAVVLVAAIFAASWFLLISPKRSEAAELKGKAVSRADANARLEQQIQVLKAQQEDLPRQRARLATLRRQIPDNPALPSLIRDLTAAGRKTGVSIDSMSPAVPVALVAPGLVALRWRRPPRAPTPQRAPTPHRHRRGRDDDPGCAGRPSRTLYQVPLTVNVTGTLLRARAVPQQGRELPALVPGQWLHARRRTHGRRGRTTAGQPHDRPDRPGVPQPAGSSRPDHHGDRRSGDDHRPVGVTHE